MVRRTLGAKFGLRLIIFDTIASDWNKSRNRAFMYRYMASNSYAKETYVGVPTVHRMSRMYGTVIRVPSTGPVRI